jgi:hypothetical protein
MAVTNYFVDPAINANSGTGTIGDPFGDLQYALNNVTRNSTDGDMFHIKAGTAEVLTADLSLATYGTPTAAAALYFQGYTATAGDGGIGEISGGGSVGIYDLGNNASKTFLHFWDMKLGNCGAARILSLGATCSLVNCEVHTSTATLAVNVTGGFRAVGCLFRDISGTSNVSISSGEGSFVYCVFRSSGGTQVLNATSSGFVTVVGCVFDLSTDTSLSGSLATGTYVGNTFYTAAANTLGLLRTGSNSNSAAVVVNNVVVGSSGTGGIGYQLETAQAIHGGNAYYNNTTNQSASATNKAAYELKAPLSLGANPFVDAANDDFNLATGSTAIEAAWPSAWKGYAATTNAADIGAVQAGAGAGGGVIRRVARILGG